MGMKGLFGREEREKGAGGHRVGSLRPRVERQAAVAAAPSVRTSSVAQTTSKEPALPQEFEERVPPRDESTPTQQESSVPDPTQMEEEQQEALQEQVQNLTEQLMEKFEQEWEPAMENLESAQEVGMCRREKGGGCLRWEGRDAWGKRPGEGAGKQSRTEAETARLASVLNSAGMSRVCRLACDALLVLKHARCRSFSDPAPRPPDRRTLDLPSPRRRPWTTWSR